MTVTRAAVVSLVLSVACGGDEAPILTMDPRPPDPVAEISAAVGRQQGNPAAAEAPPAIASGGDRTAEIATLKVRVLELEDALRRRDERIATLEAQTRAAREDADRYEAGLQRAVAQLNIAQRREHRQRSRSAPAARRAPTPAYIHSPDVVVFQNGTIRVASEAYNPGRETIEGRVVIEVDGRQVKAVTMSIPPSGRRRFDETVAGGGFSGQTPVVDAIWEPAR